VIPLTLCIPRGDTPAVDLAITGSPQVFDGFGPLETELILPSNLGGRIGVLVPIRAQNGQRQCLVEIYYRPTPLNGRVSVRVPATVGHRIQQARFVLWGEREKLRLGVVAFSIGTVGPDLGRHPIIAVCSEFETDRYATVWHINRFDRDYEHEISWPVSP
jgi:hypothetical protein